MMENAKWLRPAGIVSIFGGLGFCLAGMILEIVAAANVPATFPPRNANENVNEFATFVQFDTLGQGLVHAGIGFAVAGFGLAGVGPMAREAPVQSTEPPALSGSILVPEAVSRPATKGKPSIRPNRDPNRDPSERETNR